MFRYSHLWLRMCQTCLAYVAEATGGKMVPSTEVQTCLAYEATVGKMVASTEVIIAFFA